MTDTSTAVSYTTVNAIRAAMGMSAYELKDNQITDLRLGDQLDLFFMKIAPTSEAIKALAEGDAPDPVTDEYTNAVYNYKVIQLLAMYQGAAVMLVAFQTLAFQQMSDGGVTQFRFAPDDLTTLLANVLAQRDSYWAILDPGYNIAAMIPNMFSAVSPSYDPVTNRGWPRPAGGNLITGLGTEYGYGLWRGVF